MTEYVDGVRLNYRDLTGQRKRRRNDWHMNFPRYPKEVILN